MATTIKVMRSRFAGKCRCGARVRGDDLIAYQHKQGIVQCSKCSPAAVPVAAGQYRVGPGRDDVVRIDEVLDRRCMVTIFDIAGTVVDRESTRFILEEYPLAIERPAFLDSGSPDAWTAAEMAVAAGHVGMARV